MPHRPRRVRATALVAAAALTTTLLTAYAAGSARAEDEPATPGDPTAPLTDPLLDPLPLDEALDETLDEGKALLEPDSAREALSALTTARAVASGRREGDLTTAMRELANTRTALTGPQRAASERVPARPTDPASDDGEPFHLPADAPTRCTDEVCVHYVTSGPHAATSDYVDLVLTTLTDVRERYLAAGYRAPLPDRTRGGDARFDVYLGDIGDQGLYGYCTSDQPEPDPTPTSFDRWAYCGLDNDYSTSEFPTNTPTENLQVTVAHEYFHAVQYAYDRYEDSWFLEATAAWAEDELYDDVDDNLQYLRTSQLKTPRVPLDTFGAGGFHYGTWSFFRFLTEKYQARQGGLPRLVLDVLRKADGSRGAPDQYSWQAVDTVLRAKGTTGAAMLGRYAVANRRPASSYDEGRAGRYPTARLVARRQVPAGRTVTVGLRLNHLTTATTRLTPQKLWARDRKVRLAFDLPPLARGSVALVTSVPKRGGVSTRRVRLGPQGNGRITVPFSSRTVDHVEVTVVNGSGRFRCFVGGAYSCQGTALDQQQPMRFTAVPVR